MFLAVEGLKLRSLPSVILDYGVVEVFVIDDKIGKCLPQLLISDFSVCESPHSLSDTFSMKVLSLFSQDGEEESLISFKVSCVVPFEDVNSVGSKSNRKLLFLRIQYLDYSCKHSQILVEVFLAFFQCSFESSSREVRRLA